MNVALRDNQNPQVPTDRDGGYGVPSGDAAYTGQQAYAGYAGQQAAYPDQQAAYAAYAQQQAAYGAYGYNGGYGYDASGQPTAAYPYQQVQVGYDVAGQPVYAAAASGYQPTAAYQPTAVYPAQPYPYDYAGAGYADPAYAGQPGQPGQPTQQAQPVQPVVYPYAAHPYASYGNAGGYGGPAGPGGGYPGGPGGYGPGDQPPEPPEPPKRGKAGLIAAIVLLVVGLGLLVWALVTWVGTQQEYQVGIDEYTEVAQANVTEDVATGRPVVDFAALKQQNSEIVGWVQIPGTPVNYPVCQHGDNDYYLDHTFLGQYNLAGAAFMDYRSSSSLQDWNTVIYGHHLKNGEMFAKVADYSNQAEFDTLKNIYYVSDDGQVHVLVPLCCMVVNGYDVASIQFDFTDQASFEYYVQSLIDRSSARSATATAAGVEHIYMFSTCSYAQENDRTILVCVDLNGYNGPVIDATQSMNDIQAAADIAAGIADTDNPVEG